MNLIVDCKGVAGDKVDVWLTALGAQGADFRGLCV